MYLIDFFSVAEPVHDFATPKISYVKPMINTKLNSCSAPNTNDGMSKISYFGMLAYAWLLVLASFASLTLLVLSRCALLCNARTAFCSVRL